MSTELISHARQLANELGGGPVAASLLAMANECERLTRERDEAIAREREGLEHMGEFTRWAQGILATYPAEVRGHYAAAQAAQRERDDLVREMCEMKKLHAETLDRAKAVIADQSAAMERWQERYEEETAERTAELGRARKMVQGACDQARELLDKWGDALCERDAWKARAGRWKRAAKAQREALGEAQAAAELANEAWGRERQRRRIAEAAWQAREGERE